MIKIKNKVVLTIIAMILVLTSIGFIKKHGEVKALEKENELLLKENKILKEQQQQEEEIKEETAFKEKFKVAAETYNINWKLIYAISKLETGNFKSNVFKEKNNPGGMRNSKRYYSYSTIDEGIVEMTRNIKYNYLDKGLTTPEEMSKKYCPDGAKHWASQVRLIMEDL